MLPKRLLIIGGLAVISGLAAACTPGSNLPVEGVVSAQPPGTTVSSTSTAEGRVVEETPMSEAELTAQPTGQTEPGAGTAGAATPSAGATSEPGTVVPGQPTAYVNDEFKFRVDYPDNYVVGARSAGQLSQLVPIPVAAITFMNPELAASEAAAEEPADLEIRVYTADLPAMQTGADGLNGWLVAQGFVPADGSVTPTDWSTAHVSGAKVCSPIMTVPPCTYFVLGAGHVYQLLPITLEGETMTGTFALLP